MRAAEENTLSKAPPASAHALANQRTEPDATPAAAGVLAAPRRHRRMPDRTPAPVRAAPDPNWGEDTPESLGDAAAAAVLGADYQQVGSGSSIAVHSGSFHAVRTGELERVPSGTGFRALGPPRVSTAIRAALDRSGARLMESDPAPRLDPAPSRSPAPAPAAVSASAPASAPPAAAARTTHPPRAAVMKRRKTQDVAAMSATRAEDTSPDLGTRADREEWGREATPVPAWDALPLPRVPLEDFAVDEAADLEPPPVPREEPEPDRGAPSREVSAAHRAVNAQPLPTAARRASRDLPAVGNRVVPRSNRRLSPD